MKMRDKLVLLPVVVWFLGSILTNIEWSLCFAFFAWFPLFFTAWTSSDEKRVKVAAVILVLVALIVALCVAYVFGQGLRGARS